MGTLLVGWAFMAALYYVFMGGYRSKVPARAAAMEYRRETAGRFDLLPPSATLIGIVLWVVTGAAFVVATILALTGQRFVGVSNSVMIISFLMTLWRDDKWLKAQPDYKAAVKAAKSP